MSCGCIRTTMAAPEEVLAPTRVREQLAKILANSLFSCSQMLSRLLTFVVEQTLQGKAGEIKEYALAIAVFGRAGSFDSRLDPSYVYKPATYAPS